MLELTAEDRMNEMRAHHDSVQTHSQEQQQYHYITTQSSTHAPNKSGLTKRLPDRIDDLELRLLLWVKVNVADVLCGRAVDFARNSVLCILQIPANVAYVHVEAELMPVHAHAIYEQIMDNSKDNVGLQRL
jgi:hypothetical protein